MQIVFKNRNCVFFDYQVSNENINQFKNEETTEINPLEHNFEPRNIVNCQWELWVRKSEKCQK